MSAIQTAAVPLVTRIALLTVSTLPVMAGAIIAPSLPQLAEVFGEPPDKPILAKMMLSLPALAIVLFAPISGWITDRFGRRKLLLTGLTLYVVMGSAGLFLEEATSLLASRFLLGIATAMIMTTITTLISDYFHGPIRGRFLGYQAACMAMGGVLFLPLGGLLAQLGGWHWPFAVYALAIPMGVLAWWAIPEPARHTSETPLSVMDVALHKIRWSQVLALFAIAFLGMTAMYLMPTQLPFHLKQLFQSGPLLAGLSVATASAASAFMGVMFGRISRHVVSLMLLTICLNVMGVSYILLGELTQQVSLWPVLVVNGLGGGLLIPTLSSWMMRLAPEAARGRMSGGLISCIFLGQFLSPLLMKPLTDRHGIGPTFQFIGAGLMALGLTCLTVALVRWAIRRQQQQVSESLAVIASTPAQNS